MDTSSTFSISTLAGGVEYGSLEENVRNPIRATSITPHSVPLMSVTPPPSRAHTSANALLAPRKAIFAQPLRTSSPPPTMLSLDGPVARVESSSFSGNLSTTNDPLLSNSNASETTISTPLTYGQKHDAKKQKLLSSSSSSTTGSESSDLSLVPLSVPALGIGQDSSFLQKILPISPSAEAPRLLSTISALSIAYRQLELSSFHCSSELSLAREERDQAIARTNELEVEVSRAQETCGFLRHGLDQCLFTTQSGNDSEVKALLSTPPSLHLLRGEALNVAAQRLDLLDRQALLSEKEAEELRAQIRDVRAWQGSGIVSMRSEIERLNEQAARESILHAARMRDLESRLEQSEAAARNSDSARLAAERNSCNLSIKLETTARELTTAVERFEAESSRCATQAQNLLWAEEAIHVFKRELSARDQLLAEQASLISRLQQDAQAMRSGRMSVDPSRTAAAAAAVSARYDISKHDSSIAPAVVSTENGSNLMVENLLRDLELARAESEKAKADAANARASLAFQLEQGESNNSEDEDKDMEIALLRAQLSAAREQQEQQQEQLQQQLQQRQQQQGIHEQNAHILNSDVLEKRLVAHISELNGQEEHLYTVPTVKRSRGKRAPYREDNNMTISSFSIAVTPKSSGESGARTVANNDAGRGAKRPVRLSSASINNMDVPSLGQSSGDQSKSESDDSDNENDGSDWSGEWDEDGVLHRRHAPRR